jgi:hypothetical protein
LIEILTFSNDFRKNTQISNFMKIHQWEKSGGTDGQTGMMNVIVAFGNFANARDKTGV